MTTITIAELVIDDERRTVTLDNDLIALSRLPFDFLYKLASEPERVFRRDELLRDVWGYQTTSGVSFGSVHVCASTVRKALKQRFIFNVPRIGYRLLDV